MVKSKNFILLNVFEGEPKDSDFKLVEEELPELENGEFRTEALFWSVDPYQRAYVTKERAPQQLNKVMFGGQVAKVIESKNPDFKVGDNVYGHFGWRTHTNVNLKDQEKELLPCYKLPDFKGLPLSLGVGAIGMPGQTAYFGFLDICQPKAGETVVVTAAGGAVGSLVGQIAKIKGCKVIGIAGSDAKNEWLKKDLKFDDTINYKTQNVSEALKKAAPEGVDCYFDNVGGPIATAVMRQMNHRGRISICGCIHVYNNVGEYPKEPMIQPLMLWQELRMEGFVVPRFRDRFPEANIQLRDWILEGKLVARETITEGFENMPKALAGILRGENTGKAVVKAV